MSLGQPFDPDDPVGRDGGVSLDTELPGPVGVPPPAVPEPVGLSLLPDVPGR